MAAILNMANELMTLARGHLEACRFPDAMKVLRRLVSLPEIPPSIAADANYLIAQIHYQYSDFSAAQESLSVALEATPENADCHFLMARCVDRDEKKEADEKLAAIAHYETAARLAPEDGRKSSAYGLMLARAGKTDEGLKLLQTQYARHAADPAVVENFVDGLIEAKRLEDAELVVLQASYRNPDDSRFDDIRRRLSNRIRHERLFGESKRERGEARSVVPFRSFGGDMPPGKPRGAKKPTEAKSRLSKSGEDRDVESHRANEPAQESPRMTPPMLTSEMTLAEVLKRVGGATTTQIYQQLGLMGKLRPDRQRVEISAVLLQRVFLNSLIKKLPDASRKLLRTLVHAGGYVPASVIFQNTGPDAPPSDYAQALLQIGFVYFGKEPGRGAVSERLVAVIPGDLLDRLATVLRIKLDD